MCVCVCYCAQSGKLEIRSVPVPPHRFSPLKEHWMKIFTPIVEHLKLQIRLNLRSRHVELRVSGGRESCVCVWGGWWQSRVSVWEE